MKFHKNTYLFFPFLILYIVIVLLFHNDLMENDEARYVMFANNLLQGHYSPNEYIYLWNGPGYPIFLMPFVALKLPWILVTLSNAVLLYFSVILMYKSLSKLVHQRLAKVFSIFWALYYPVYQELANIKTETWTIFLIVLFSYFLFSYSLGGKKYTLAMSGITLGFIVLTKIIFSYVLIIAILYGLFRSFSPGKLSWSPILKISLIALLVNIPYLFYTFQLTNKLWYWGNSGGEVIYFMSSPFENEYGDWCDVDAIMAGEPRLEQEEKFYQNHAPIWNEIFKEKDGVKRDGLFKEIAITNIQNHPFKYLKNWLANISRMFFGFPFSYTYQKFQTVVRLLPGMLSFVLVIMSFYIYGKKKVSNSLVTEFLNLLTLSYLFFTSLVSAYPRHLFVIVPLILIISCIGLDRYYRMFLKN